MVAYARGEYVFQRFGGTARVGVPGLGRVAVFPARGHLPSQEHEGSEPACHICQALHMPTLAAAPLDLVSTPEFVTWYSSLPLHAAPSDSFALHRAGRAPPSA